MRAMEQAVEERRDGGASLVWDSRPEEYNHGPSIVDRIQIAAALTYE